MFLNYGCFLFLLAERKISYMFMRTAFEVGNVQVMAIPCIIPTQQSFDGSDFAFYTLVMKALALFGLFVVVPVATQSLKVHESGLLALVTALSVISYLLQGDIIALYYGH